MGASESKLAFKEDVFRLAGEPDIPADSSLWTRIYQLPESSEDVFALWSTNDLRNLTKANTNHDRQTSTSTSSAPQKNVETLIYTIVARLEALQTRHCFPDPHTPIAPQVLNCVRILTRLLPYLYEADYLSAWEDQFFWQPRTPTSTWDHEENKQGQLFDGLQPKRTYPEDAGEQEIGPPLGEHLIDLLVNYLFFPGFSLAKELDVDGKPELHVSYKIWQSGIGCKQSNGMSRENERNAMEVLRLLLALSSKTMYISPNFVATSDIKALTYMTTKSSRQVVLSLICSLLNTVSRYNPAAWRVPIDLSSIAKDPKQQLVSHAVQFLLVLITYPVPNDEPNAFRKSLGRLHRAEDFQFIQHGLNSVLTQPVSGMPSYLPGKQGAVPWAPETLQLFWELLQCNKRFRGFIIDTDRAHDFVVLVLFYAMDAKDDLPRQGIVRMCVFILQTLSVEPNFGKRLNKVFTGQESLPGVMRIQNFHGSYADYMITTIHAMITSTEGRLEPIYPALLAVISNISSHARDLQRATSSKLMGLFISFSSPKFLLANESNHLLLVSLLEAMNAVLEHQYEANRRYVDIVVRSQKRFHAMRNFTVEGALDELDRQAKERKDRGEPTGLSSPARRASLESVRSPVSARSPSLGDVPEDGTFAIGDDDDEDESSEAHTAQGRNLISSPVSMSAPRASVDEVLEDAVPVQSRSMSEKARGKQPIGQGSFSRSTSRNTSNTSLASLPTQADEKSQLHHHANGATNASLSRRIGGHFEPSPEWLASWLPHLPLHTIITTIDFENERAARQRKSRDQRLLRTSVEHTSTDPGSTVAGESAATAGANGEAAPAHPQFHDTVEKVQTFTWSPLSLGWYTSMLWSWIYAADVSTNAQNGIWAGTHVRLFNVVAAKERVISLRNPRGAVDAAGNAIAQRISSLSVGQSTSKDV